MAPRILRFKKTIIVASIAALSVAGAGAAFAYWTSTGTGDGDGARPVHSCAAFVVNVEGAKAGDPLAPGDLAGQTVSVHRDQLGAGASCTWELWRRHARACPPCVAGVVTPWAPAGCLGIDDYTAADHHPDPRP